MASIPNRNDFARALTNLFDQAEQASQSQIILTAGELHRKVGGYPDYQNRMSTCAGVMRKAMQEGDQILHQPPQGKGASLKILYSLPRQSDTKPFFLPDEVQPQEPLIEGATNQITVNAYERNQKARQACIDHYGCFCQVCEIDFEKQYGELGKGYIHVHHIKPLSTIREKYEVDPINDLIPVCPNCHAMLHQQSPPLGIDELKNIFKLKY